MVYRVCWTEDDGLYCCDHDHPTIIDAVDCMVPNGRTFIRGFDADHPKGRSLEQDELDEFNAAVSKMAAQKWNR